jgi:hypothetical protein
VVRKNDAFALLDLSQGPAVVAAHADEFGQNSYFLLRGRGTDRTVKLIGVARDRIPSDALPQSGFGVVIGPEDLTPGPTVEKIDMGGEFGLRVVLSNPDDVLDLEKVRYRHPQAQADEAHS